MATCRRCRKPITKAQAPSSKKISEGGKVVGMQHGKCHRLTERAARNNILEQQGTSRAGADAPTAYEAAIAFDDRRVDAQYAKAREASAELASQREEAMLDERRHDDWRDPSTLSLDAESGEEVVDLSSLI